MIQFMATLRFPTGEVVYATLIAESPEQEPPVHYEGAVHLLPSQPECADAPHLERLFRKFANDLGAIYSCTCNNLPSGNVVQ